MVMRRERPRKRYCTMKERCPEAVTSRPKPGRLSSQYSVRSAPSSTRAFCANAGVNFLRMIAPFRNVTWRAGQHRVSGCAVYDRKGTETIRNGMRPSIHGDSGALATIGKISPAMRNGGLVMFNQRAR
jgi:hypothetical protein